MAENSGKHGLLAPGSTIAGYVVEQQIGQGGMAVVYRARDVVLGRLAAVKVLPPMLAADEEFRARFLRESRAVAAVDEPHIVPVYAAGEADGVLYIATRLVADGDLAALQRAAGGPLPPAQAANLIGQIAGALDAAHTIGLVHRDVKPGNILIERAPERPEHAYLSDFGLAKSAAGGTGITATGQFMGTPDYCAPEQVVGRAVDGRTDQYSLACVAFSLLAGIVPFNRGDSMSRLYAHVNSPVPALTAIRPELPPAVNVVLARGMAKSPGERYESCTAFARALQGALGVGAGARLGGRPTQGILPFPGGGSGSGYEHTATAVGWQHPSIPPGTEGWQEPGTPSDPVGAWPPGPAGTWRPGTQGPVRPPRKHTGLIAGGAAAAAVTLVVGVVAGIVLSSHQGTTSAPPRPARSGSGTATAAATAGTTTSPTAGTDQMVTATLAGTLSVPGGNLKNGAFLSPDGQYAAAGGADGIYVFSTQSMGLIKHITVGASDDAHQGDVDPVSFSPDDKTLYALDVPTGKMYDLDIATGTQQNAFSIPGSAVTFSGGFDARVIVACDSTGTCAEYDLATGDVVAKVPNPGSSPVGNISTDTAGKHVLISDKNGVTYLVDAPSAKVITQFSSPGASANTFTPDISPDGNTVWVPGGATASRLWDVASGSYVTPTDPRWPAQDEGVEFSIDGKFIVTTPAAGSDGQDIWNIAARAHVSAVAVPGGAHEFVVGPVASGASELLTISSAGSLNLSDQTYSKLFVWAVPE